MNNRIEKLLSQLTLAEKVSLLAGADLWHSVPVERLGIPVLKVTDGPNGARGADANSGPASACFPVGVALGATWNPALVERVGAALAEETKAKGAHILLAPTVNIHRSPLAGRNFECYSEDPYLTGCLAIGYIRGLQSQGVGACIKHFVCNDSEFERFTISSEVQERPLREIYLAPFQAAIREARPWAVMSAYNRVNGVYASENSYTLLEILKGEWGFDGLVISDWYGTYSERVAAGGLDLEMPGPARWLGQNVLEGVEGGALSEAVVDDKVRRLLRTLERVGAFDQPELPPEQAIDRPEHRQLAGEAAVEAIVLLKNEKETLPLQPEKLRRVAVIGENGRRPQIQGGGSAAVTPHYLISPLDSITARLPDTVAVAYALGCPVHKRLPLLDPHWLTAAGSDSHGLHAEYFSNRELSGEPVHQEIITRLQQSWFGETATHFDPNNFSLRLTGTLKPAQSGNYAFTLLSVGRSRLKMNGHTLIDNWDRQSADTQLWESREEAAELFLDADQVYDLALEYASPPGSRWRTVRLGAMAALPADPIQEAVELAALSDVVLLFAGLTSEWESEGFDRPDMGLPGDQATLIEQVAAANPNTIVILNTGSPVEMPWLDQVPALLQAWYTGQEAANALTAVLLGDANPSGKLPTTFPRRLADNPAYINYPGENGRVLYGEGLYVGYRYYDKKEIEPLFPFGHGLSYTRFSYHNLRLNGAEFGPGDTIQVSVDVSNSGRRAGKEVVQLYVRDVESKLARPLQELKAFSKVTLEPGESRTVTFDLDHEALAYYDPAQGAAQGAAPGGWVAEAGEFELRVGSSSRDIRLTARFTWSGDADADSAELSDRLHIGLPLQALMTHIGGKEVLRKHLGDLLDHPQAEMAMAMSLEQLAVFVPQQLTPEVLRAINDDLRAL
jgi:beta-glucosidase